MAVSRETEIGARREAARSVPRTVIFGHLGRDILSKSRNWRENARCESAPNFDPNLESWLRATLPGLGAHDSVAIKTAGLVGFWLLFLGAYLAICAIMATLMAPSPLGLARSFALALVPIAIGYHVAHYLVFLLIQGQYIVPLASDPFGNGWNLFGTAGYPVDIAI